MSDENRHVSSPSYVAAFRTHVWDPTVAGMAARMEAFARRGRFVVLADETAGRLDVAPHEKVAYSVDLSGIGIPVEPPHRTLWFSRDHALYVLLHALPRHDYYVMSEYDVQVNARLDELVAAAAARGLDLVAAKLRPVDQAWPWYHNARAHFDDPWGILFAVVVVSRRALERLYAERLAHAARRRAGETGEWAHCEGFVPSVIAAAPGMRMADLSEFVRLPYFTWDVAKLAGAPELDEPGTMFHPVLGRDSQIARLFRQFPPADYLNPESTLRRLMDGFSFAEALPHLRLALAQQGSAEGLARLQCQLRGEAWVSAEEAARAASDIARGKPCTQSSVAPPWSRGATVEEDAGYVVAPDLAPDCANHTDTEDEPWWQVDLGAPHALREVEVLNRTLESVQARLNAYFLLGSLDGESWFCLHFRPYGLPVSGNAERPECIALDHLPVARFVRVQLPDRGLLNLRRVRIWGDPAPAGGAAAG